MPAKFHHLAYPAQGYGRPRVVFGYLGGASMRQHLVREPSIFAIR